jgi:predicted ATPase
MGTADTLFDEPEAALSPTRRMALLAAMHDLVRRDSQFLIATHSPILLGYPGATIYLLRRARNRSGALH